MEGYGVVDVNFAVGPVATKMKGPYERGDRLLYEKPWIFAVSEKSRMQICNHCFQSVNCASDSVDPTEFEQTPTPTPKIPDCEPMPELYTFRSNLKRCTGCGFSFYCGRECQRANWKFIHKHECSVFKKALETEELTVPLSIETVRLCLQALIRIKNDPKWDEPSDGFPVLNHRIFSNLMSHWDEIKLEQQELDFIDLLCNYFYRVLKGQDEYGDLLELERLGVIYGKVRINNMTIFGTYGDKLGVGLYLSASAIDHACLPNACPSFAGTLLNIHATESVDCFDNARLSYLDQIYLSARRRDMLQKRYFFDCFCRACLDKTLDKRMNSIRCPNQSCSSAVHMDPYSMECDSCPSCGRIDDKVAVDQIVALMTKARDAQVLMSEAKKSDDHRKVLDLAESLYRDLSPVFHDINSLVIATALQVASSADVLGQFEKAFSYFDALKVSYPITFPKWSFQNAEILMKCTTRGLLVKSAAKDQRALLDDFVAAMTIVAVCAGRDSPTFAYYKKFYDDCRDK